jgi:two-component system chemotaxis response regulator CheY
MPDVKQIRALVVDDQANMRTLIRSALRDIGVTTIEDAYDGVRALEITEKYSPNLVISDFIMPNLDGFGLLRALRAATATKKTAFIMLSGHADKELVQSAAQYGANDYLVKPFTQLGLRKSLEAIFGPLK